MTGKYVAYWKKILRYLAIVNIILASYNVRHETIYLTRHRAINVWLIENEKAQRAAAEGGGDPVIQNLKATISRLS